MNIAEKTQIFRKIINENPQLKKRNNMSSEIISCEYLESIFSNSFEIYNPLVLTLLMITQDIEINVQETTDIRFFSTEKRKTIVTYEDYQSFSENRLNKKIRNELGSLRKKKYPVKYLLVNKNFPTQCVCFNYDGVGGSGRVVSSTYFPKHSSFKVYETFLQLGGVGKHNISEQSKILYDTMNTILLTAFGFDPNEGCLIGTILGVMGSP